MTSAMIVGLAGLTLSADERAFLKDAQPAGVILFARNADQAGQISSLINAVYDAIGHDNQLVLIDQEGGRVQRIRAPVVHDLPPAATFGEIYADDPQEAVRLAGSVGQLAGADLRALGITMDCAPVADLLVEGAHEIIGDRAFGHTVKQVVALARAFADGLTRAGVVPVIKHIPGHGRATADSHLALPVVETDRATLAETDFQPFRQLADLPAAMTAHVVFSAVDADLPASISPRLTEDVMRNEIGFDGLLMSDDLSMQALSGAMKERARAVLAAGSDLALHCNGSMPEMIAVANVAPQLTGQSLERFMACMEIAKKPPQTLPDDASKDLAVVMAQRTSKA